MTAHALMHVDKATFYRFIVKADEAHRYEFVRGWIMQQQAGGTLRHVRIGSAFVAILRQQLNGDRWIVCGPDRGIDTGPTVRYPDAVVERPGAADDSLSTEAPVVIVEVMSPSSEERELSAKPIEYLALASLETYIVASQDEALCYVWMRGADHGFTESPLVVKGRDSSITVAELGIVVPLAEIYRGVEFDPG